MVPSGGMGATVTEGNGVIRGVVRGMVRAAERAVKVLHCADGGIESGRERVGRKEGGEV